MSHRLVIIRDDDTNATTPIEALDTIYRPFLEHNLPISLAIIPLVDPTTSQANGTKEPFIYTRCIQKAFQNDCIPLKQNPALIEYLKKNQYELVMHGCHHTFHEFGTDARQEIQNRLKRGFQAFEEADLQRPSAFVAPYEAISRAAFSEITQNFSLLSSHWYSIKKIPIQFWPSLISSKLKKQPYWKANTCLCLTRPRQFFSSVNYTLQDIVAVIETSPITVLLTHWWEFFDQEGARKLKLLHELAGYLATNSSVKVVALNRNPLSLL